MRPPVVSHAKRGELPAGVGAAWTMGLRKPTSEPKGEELVEGLSRDAWLHRQRELLKGWCPTMSDEERAKTAEWALDIALLRADEERRGVHWPKPDASLAEDVQRWLRCGRWDAEPKLDPRHPLYESLVDFRDSVDRRRRRA